MNTTKVISVVSSYSEALSIICNKTKNIEKKKIK